MNTDDIKILNDSLCWCVCGRLGMVIDADNGATRCSAECCHTHPEPGQRGPFLRGQSISKRIVGTADAANIGDGSDRSPSWVKVYTTPEQVSGLRIGSRVVVDVVS